MFIQDSWPWICTAPSLLPRWCLNLAFFFRGSFYFGQISSVGESRWFFHLGASDSSVRLLFLVRFWSIINFASWWTFVAWFLASGQGFLGIRNNFWVRYGTILALTEGPINSIQTNDQTLDVPNASCASNGVAMSLAFVDLCQRGYLIGCQSCISMSSPGMLCNSGPGDLLLGVWPVLDHWFYSVWTPIRCSTL
jgi:hypothetical protein